MQKVWTLVVAILMTNIGPIDAAENTKKNIPLFKGKPGIKIGDVCINPKDGAKMVWVPAGNFLMGISEEGGNELLKTNPELKEILDAEKPQRKVYLDGYWVYKYEVTVGQYRKFCKAKNIKMPPAPDWGWNDDHPMVYVRWQDAEDYAKWAGVSLPTEAQWEKAARGTDGRKYPWGNTWSALKCANSVNAEMKGTKPVGSYLANASPYGCMDMAGNAWEWCADWYDPNYYKNAPSKNPQGPSGTVKFTLRGVDFNEGALVLRGGSWLNPSSYFFQCTYRYNFDPGHRSFTRGFRCVKTL